MFEPLNFSELMEARPEVVHINGEREYVQNPFFSTKPLIEINRKERTVKETRWMSVEDMLFDL